jgi:hypothetical protein
MGKESVSYGGKSSAKDFIIIFLVLVVVGLLVAWFVFGSGGNGGEVEAEIDNSKVSKEKVEDVVRSGSEFSSFGVVKIESEFELDGVGENVDSMDFWIAPNSEDSLLFVTGKESGNIEVYKFPFDSGELNPLVPETKPNGVAVDNDDDLLYVGESGTESVSVYTLPELEFVRKFGEGILGKGETNLDIMNLENGEKLILVSDDKNVYGFNFAGEQKIKISPPVDSIETVQADDFHQLILIPEEQGGSVPSTGIYVYNADGSEHEKDGSNVFGTSHFNEDEEGIALYKCFESSGRDDGRGFYIVADQDDPLTNFVFFDRITWQHLGNLQVEGIAHTDGIAITQEALPGYSSGLFAAIDDDTSTGIVDVGKIIEATGLVC